MDNLFGIPISTLAVSMGVCVGIVFVVLLILATTHGILLKIGVRNILRRPSQTVLMISGLTLSTILIMSSFGLSDCVSYSSKLVNLSQVGNLDEGVTPGNAALSPTDSQRIVTTIKNIPNVEAVTYAISTHQESYALYDMTSKLVSADNSVLALQPDFTSVWGALHDNQGNPVNFADLSTGNLDVGKKLASVINAHVGDTVHVFVQSVPITFTIHAILDTDINPTLGTSPTFIVPFAQFQSLLKQDTSTNIFYIKNKGQGRLNDLGPNNTVSNNVATALHQQFPSYKVTTFKEDAVNAAITAGSTTTLVMTGFSSLLILAGVLLVYLIFVMLAAERKAELGMSRAIGMKRRHLILTFLFEGMVYALASTAISIPLGLGVTALIVQFVSGATITPALGTLHWQVHVEPVSMFISFCLGLLLTFLMVMFSAYRVSRTNILAAIRDLPEEAKRDVNLADMTKAVGKSFSYGYRALRQGHPLHFLFQVTVGTLIAIVRLIFAIFLRGPLTIITGVLFFVIGIHSRTMFSYALGVSLLLVGSGLLTRWIVVLTGGGQQFANRLGISLLSITLLFYWLQPLGPVEKLIGVYDTLALDTFQSGAEDFVLTLFFVMLSSIWLIMYNGDVLIKGVMVLTQRFGRLAPVTRTSMAYPLYFKFRTGLTVMMFTLVIFIMVLIVMFSTILRENSQTTQDQLNGGWQLEIDSPGTPPNFISQVQANQKLAQEVKIVASIQTQPFTVQQLVPGRKGHVSHLLLRAADDTFLTKSHFALQYRAAGYTSDRQIWDTVRDQEDVAVYYNDPTAPLVGLSPHFQPFMVQIQDAQASGATHLVKIIGILPPLTNWPGLYVSSKSSAHLFPDPAAAHHVYFFTLQPGVTVNQGRVDIGSTFGSTYGVQVSLVVDAVLLNAVIDSLVSFLTGYLALGLVIGTCALGVVSSRAVVERRQQIGMLRALGYSRNLVYLSFLLESSFITGLGLIIGTALGIWAAYLGANAFLPSQNSFISTIPIPVLQIGLLLISIYLASLLTTYLPARTAATIRPAEALRYE